MIKKLIFLALFFISTQSYCTESDTIIHSPTRSYEVYEILGQGAFGKVFSAKDTIGNWYAIKMYHSPSSEHGGYGFWERLGDVQREFDRGQYLDHPHIIKSYEFFSVEEIDSTFLVLEYINGNVIGEINKQSISIDDGLNAALQLVDGLKYAYSKEVLHLDLHEWNVMMNKENETKIIDLGSFFTFEEVEKLFYALFKNVQLRGLFSEEINLDHVEKLRNFIEKNRQHVTVPTIKHPHRSHTQNVEEMYKGVHLMYIYSVFNMATTILSKGNYSEEQIESLNLEMDSYLEELKEEFDTEKVLEGFDYLRDMLKNFNTK